MSLDCRYTANICQVKRSREETTVITEFYLSIFGCCHPIPIFFQICRDIYYPGCSFNNTRGIISARFAVMKIDIRCIRIKFKR